jgi:hypothetical protein
MTARCIDAAAWTVALAGDDDPGVAAAFPVSARERLLRATQALRAPGSRSDRARALAAAGLRLLGAADAPPSDVVGARFLAAWLRAMPAADREGFVRGLRAEALAAVRAALQSAPRLDAAQRSAATHLASVAHRALRRPPTLAEWSALLEGLALRGAIADPALRRAERALRLDARADECLALAAEVCAR